MADEEKEIAEIRIHTHVPREELKQFLMKYMNRPEPRGEDQDPAPRMRSGCVSMGCPMADTITGEGVSGCWFIVNTDGGTELHCLYGEKEVVLDGSVVVIEEPHRGRPPWEIR